MTTSYRDRVLAKVHAAGPAGISWTALAGTLSAARRESLKLLVDELVREREIVREEVRQAKGPRAVRLYPPGATPRDWEPPVTRRLVLDIPERLREELDARLARTGETATDVVRRALERELGFDLL